MTLVLLHGTGGDENDLLQLGRELAPKAALLSPRGHVLENGLPRFFRRIAEGVFDTEDLVFRTHELADFIQAASKTYGLGTVPLVAVGYSNGANIAASLLFLHPKLLSGAVLFRPMVPYKPKKLPDLSGVRVLISAGRADQIVPKEQPKLLFDLFRASHAEATVHWENSNHSMAAAEVQFARNWFLELPWFRK